MEKKYGIVILAAGASTRLGSPKQLLPYAGSTLLQHVLSAANAIRDAAVVVVTGSGRTEVEKTLQNSSAVLSYNANWQSGMASSIRAGIGRLVSEYPQIEAAVIAVCDQPYVSAEIFQQLIDTYETSGKGICACSYGHTIGTPVLFNKRYFADLQALEGDEGAKRILKTHADDVATIPFSRGDVDVDTTTDYEKIT